MTEAETGVRLDQWLWAARFFKTRSQSSAAIKKNRVAVSGKSAKASLTIRCGDHIEVRKGPYRFEIEVIGLASRRGNAEKAQGLYQESESSIRSREQIQNTLRAQRTMAPKGFASGGRPTKKGRRELMALKKAYLRPEEIDDD